MDNVTDSVNKSRIVRTRADLSVLVVPKIQESKAEEERGVKAKGPSYILSYRLGFSEYVV